MDIEREKVVVAHDNVSPLAAKIVRTYFVDKCNEPDRANSTFIGAESYYDETTQQMIVEAALTPSTSQTVGREAVERAFQFAEDMLAS